MGVYEMFIVPGTNFITLGHFGTHTRVPLTRSDDTRLLTPRHATNDHTHTRAHTHVQTVRGHLLRRESPLVRHWHAGRQRLVRRQRFFARRARALV
jgi:hypothetical protein